MTNNITKKIEWAVREVETKEIKAMMWTEHDAIEMAGAVNRQANKEILEIVKIITTVEIATV